MRLPLLLIELANWLESNDTPGSALLLWAGAGLERKPIASRSVGEHRRALRRTDRNLLLISDTKRKF